MPLLEKLTKAIHSNDVHGIRAILQTAVPGYQPDSQVADWIYSKRNY
jgi:hypothetical protein